jgi:hypothetical protein
MKNEITHQIGDRVKVLHNIPLGNLIGTVTAIHYDTYEVTLDGGGKDNMYGFQLERITDTPETDAVREMWLMTPNVELCDGRPIHGNVVDVEFARKMERHRDEWKASVKELEAECTRLHSHWHAAEERANVAEARLKERNERLRKLSNAASVLWEEHKAFGEDMHDTEGVDFLGTDSEGHAMMQALVEETLASESKREAAGTADETSGRSGRERSSGGTP